jgi:hypothetical protein
MAKQFTKMPRDVAFVMMAGLVLSGCTQQPTTSERTTPTTSPTAMERRSDETKDAAVSFVNKVWRVRESSGVAPRQLYAFLSEGTLVMASPNGKPALGTWKYEGGALTMVEEGIPYKTDILKLSKDEFRIRSNNPGGAVEITLVPAEGSSPPK